MKLFRSVKFRLTFWYAFFLTVILLGVTWFMYAQFSAMLRIGTDRELASQIASFESSLTDIFQTNFGDRELKALTHLTLNEKEYPEDIRALLVRAVVRWETEYQQVRRSGFMIRFLAFDDQPLLANLKNWQNDIIFPHYERDSVFMETGRSFQTIHFQGKPIRLYYHLFRLETRPLFIMQAAKSTEEQEKTLAQLFWIILISVPGLILLACMVSWFLVERSFAPVNDMVQRAKEISADQMDRRLPRSEARDELDRLAETLNQMIERIEISNRTIKEFSSNVSHELKTPLAIIRGEIDLALRKSRSEASLKETLRVIDGEINEMIRLVGDLNLLVRSDARALKMDFVRVSLQELLQQVVDLFRDRAVERKLLLQLVADHEAVVMADPLYLKRLFSNLIDNAIKFTEAQGHIVVDLAVTATEAIVKVVDDGIGIDPELRDKVFMRFFRTDQARSREGAGLGLSIVKAIAEAHSAQISLDSSPGQGTTVLVRLPLY
ncbi:MAG: sensor histidine kinase [Candidatus Omnitrophota bacterium]